MRASHLGMRPFKKGFAIPAAGGPTPGSGDDFAPTISGWSGTRIFFDDFDTNVAEGSASDPDGPFLSNAAYSSKWTAYNEFGYVTNQNPNQGGNGNHYGGGLSVSNSELVMRHFRGSDGKWWACAPVPSIAGWGQLYGRYAIKWRVTTPNSQVKTAFELWPDSNDWPHDGEIDFPEGTTTSNISAFMHRQNGANGGDQDQWDTGVAYGTGYHTTILEWKPNHCKFILDGTSSPTYTNRVPNTDMHWILQTEPNLGGAQPSGECVFKIDKVAIWNYTGP